MKSFITAILLAGWFFTFEHQYDKTAIVRGVVGPFASERECDEQRVLLASLIQESGLAGVIKVCLERVES